MMLVNKKKKERFIALKRLLKDYGYSLSEIPLIHSSRSARSILEVPTLRINDWGFTKCTEGLDTDMW